MSYDKENEEDRSAINRILLIEDNAPVGAGKIYSAIAALGAARVVAETSLSSVRSNDTGISSILDYDMVIGPPPAKVKKLKKPFRLGGYKYKGR